MPQSLSRVYIHAIFSTKERRPFLKSVALRQELHRYMGGILNKLDCQVFEVGGVEDHVHLLCALSRTCSQADMIKEVKRSSSLWLKTKEASLSEFAWQGGYGIFSVEYLEKTRQYIQQQEEHHRHVTFQDEFREMLKRYDIPYDERYVWD